MKCMLGLRTTLNLSFFTVNTVIRKGYSKKVVEILQKIIVFLVLRSKQIYLYVYNFRSFKVYNQHELVQQE